MLRIDLHRGRGDRLLDLEEDDHIMCTRRVCVVSCYKELLGQGRNQVMRKEVYCRRCKKYGKIGTLKDILLKSLSFQGGFPHINRPVLFCSVCSRCLGVVSDTGFCPLHTCVTCFAAPY